MCRDAQATPGQPGGERMLTSFAEAAAPADWALAWAAAPVLDDASVPPAYAWSALRLRSPPVASTVIAHLRAVWGPGSTGWFMRRVCTAGLWPLSVVSGGAAAALLLVPSVFMNVVHGNDPVGRCDYMRTRSLSVFQHTDC